MKNTYYLLRHGEAFSNTTNLISCWPEKTIVNLTKRGREQIKKSAKKLKNIDLMFSSDILRTVQTSEIVTEKLEILPKYDKRLREYNVGEFNGGPIEKVRNFFKEEEERFEKRIPQGETYNDLLKRLESFLKEKEGKYSGKNILVVSHQVSLTLLEGLMRGLRGKEILKKYPVKKRIKKGEIRKI